VKYGERRWWRVLKPYSGSRRGTRAVYPMMKKMMDNDDKVVEKIYGKIGVLLMVK